MDETDLMDEVYRAQRCTAKSKQSGSRCRRWAITGGTVCTMHGGKAPQVVAAARSRMQALITPALDRLADLLGSDNEAIALRAVTFIYDHGVDEHGDPLGLPMPTLEQIESWIAELEVEANR